MRYACQEEDACDQSCFGVALAGFLEYCFSGQSRGAPPHQRGSDASRRTAGGRGPRKGLPEVWFYFFKMRQYTQNASLTDFCCTRLHEV